MSGRRRQSHHGQSLVEFALLAPLLILILAGVVDLGRMFFTYEATVNAARGAARYCALYSAQTPDLTTIVENEMNLSPLPSGSTVTSSPTCDGSLAQGDPVTVTVSIKMPDPLFSSVVGGNGSITITASGTMMVEGSS